MPSARPDAIGRLCARCTALCCNYITVELDDPEDESDFDEIRWFLLHEGTTVYRDDDSWYVQFETRCRHLDADQRADQHADQHAGQHTDSCANTSRDHPPARDHQDIS